MKTSQLILGLLSTLVLFPLQLPIGPARAQQNQLDPVLANAIGSPAYNYNAPVLAGLGAPPGRRGSATRTSCALSSPFSLTALAPKTLAPLVSETSGQLTNKTYESVLSVTTHEIPTFWFYVPALPDGVSFEFVLQDNSDNTLYERTFTSNEGIIKITLPGDGPKLQIDQPYQWFLTTDCGPANPLFIHGWINRVSAPNLPLAEATPREQAAIYASHGLWQDAVTLLGELYQSTPEDPDIASDWASLLASVNLAEIAEKPMLDCCEP